MVAHFSSKFSKDMQTAVAAFMLVLCLLGTNCIGLSHSILHANQQSQSLEKYSASDSFKGLSHSADVCHLFDALSLATFLPTETTSFIQPPPLLLQQHLFAQKRLEKTKLSSYLSRAPPTFIL